MSSHACIIYGITMNRNISELGSELQSRVIYQRFGLRNSVCRTALVNARTPALEQLKEVISNRYATLCISYVPSNQNPAAKPEQHIVA
jgi:hypothetical protein